MISALLHTKNSTGKSVNLLMFFEIKVQLDSLV